MSKKIILEGRNTVVDGLKSDKVITSIMISVESARDPKIKEIIDLAKSKDVPVNFTSSKSIKKLSQSLNPQNVIAEMEVEDLSIKDILEREKNPLILLYNKLDYEQNLGAILRTAWGGGVSAVVVSPSGVHKLTPVVTKISMGGATAVPLIAESLFPVLKQIKDAGIPIVGVEEEMGEVYTDQNLIGPVAFLFGGEDSGLSEPLKKYCDVFIHIPMKKGLPSLNVSVASAVVLFEKLRQENS